MYAFAARWEVEQTACAVASESGDFSLVDVRVLTHGSVRIFYTHFFDTSATGSREVANRLIAYEKLFFSNAGIAIAYLAPPHEISVARTYGSQ